MSGKQCDVTLIMVSEYTYQDIFLVLCKLELLTYQFIKVLDKYADSKQTLSPNSAI